jgi:hypothetical protein
MHVPCMPAYKISTSPARINMHITNEHRQHATLCPSEHSKQEQEQYPSEVSRQIWSHQITPRFLHLSHKLLPTPSNLPSKGISIILSWAARTAHRYTYLPLGCLPSNQAGDSVTECCRHPASWLATPACISCPLATLWSWVHAHTSSRYADVPAALRWASRSAAAWRCNVYKDMKDSAQMSGQGLSTHTPRDHPHGPSCITIM